MFYEEKSIFFYLSQGLFIFKNNAQYLCAEKLSYVQKAIWGKSNPFKDLYGTPLNSKGAPLVTGYKNLCKHFRVGGSVSFVY